MIKEYVVTLDDPVSELCRQNIAGDAGVYFIFAAKVKVNEDGGRVFALRKLLYIGRSNDVNRRINGQHHRHGDIVAACKSGEIACYYYARISRSDGMACREEDYVRAESALIYEKQPLLNRTATVGFRHELTIVNLERCAESVNRDPTTGCLKDLPLAFGQTLIVAI